MAQKVQVILVDDLDSGSADETVSFSLDGVAYEIDLSTTNAERLRDALSPYVGSARRIGSRSTGGGRQRRASGSGGAGTSKNKTAEIRAWARENGHKVNERGRIPANVVEAYENAHG